MGGSKKQTVGYKYYMGAHMVLCHGPVDRITKIWVDDRTAWTGEARGDGAGYETLPINQPELFGGTSREGGVVGEIDIGMGYPDQGVNSYLSKVLSGKPVPAYRQVVSVIFRKLMIGMNPYLKPWRFQAQRIWAPTTEGVPQWNPSMAGISDPAPPYFVAPGMGYRGGLVGPADPNSGYQDGEVTYDYILDDSHSSSGPLQHPYGRWTNERLPFKIGGLVYWVPVEIRVGGFLQEEYSPQTVPLYPFGVAVESPLEGQKDYLKNSDFEFRSFPEGSPTFPGCGGQRWRDEIHALGTREHHVKSFVTGSIIWLSPARPATFTGDINQEEPLAGRIPPPGSIRSIDVVNKVVTDYLLPPDLLDSFMQMWRSNYKSGVPSHRLTSAFNMMHDNRILTVLGSLAYSLDIRDGSITREDWAATPFPHGEPTDPDIPRGYVRMATRLSGGGLMIVGVWGVKINDNVSRVACVFVYDMLHNQVIEGYPTQDAYAYLSNGKAVYPYNYWMGVAGVTGDVVVPLRPGDPSGKRFLIIRQKGLNDWSFDTTNLNAPDWYINEKLEVGTRGNYGNALSVVGADGCSYDWAVGQRAANGDIVFLPRYYYGHVLHFTQDSKVGSPLLVEIDGPTGAGLTTEGPIYYGADNNQILRPTRLYLPVVNDEEGGLDPEVPVGPAVIYAAYAGNQGAMFGWYSLEIPGDPNPTPYWISSSPTFVQVFPSTKTNFAAPIGQSDKWDMNPAHIIRECLTNTVWGRGLPESLIGPSYLAAATQLYREGLGLSMLWTEETPISDFIDEVIRHIDAVRYEDPDTGLQEIKLIRPDYNVAGLPVLGPHNSNVTQVVTPALADLTNQVTVTYWNRETGEDAVVTVQDTSAINMVGSIINAAMQYSGITRDSVALQVAQRDLARLSKPFRKGSLTTNRKAANLKPGDPFVLNDPSAGITAMVCRVARRAENGSLNGEYGIEFGEDVFGEAFQVANVPPPSGWTDPVPVPANFSYVAGTEAPFALIAANRGTAAADALPEEVTFAILAGGRPLDGAYLNYNQWDFPASAVGPERDDAATQSDFTPFLISASDAAPGVAGTVDVSGVVSQDMAAVEPGHVVMVEDELLATQSVVSGAGVTTVVLLRAVADTVPSANYPAGAPFFFIGTEAGAADDEWLAGEAVVTYGRPVNGKGQYQGVPTQITIPMAGRQGRPYPPALVQVDGYISGQPGNSHAVPVTEVLVEWRHRDRVGQSDQLVSWFDSRNFGPEPGVTYRVRVTYQDAGGTELAVVDQDAGVGNSAVIAFAGAPALARWAVIRVDSIRGDLECLQKWDTRVAVRAALLAPTDLQATYVPDPVGLLAPTDLTARYDTSLRAPTDLSARYDTSLLAPTDLSARYDTSLLAPTDLTARYDTSLLAPTDLSARYDTSLLAPTLQGAEYVA